MKLKIAYSDSVRELFSTDRPMINIDDADYTETAAIVIDDKQWDVVNEVNELCFGIPIIVFSNNPEDVSDEHRNAIYRLIDINRYNKEITSGEIELAVTKYEGRVVPPFFEKLSDYMDLKNLQFNCPGHQSGQYFKKHPAGKAFYNFYGEMLFRSDICNADVELGDLLIHEGPAEEAVKNASKVYNSDNTYFVMNGTSTSNNVAISALITPGDLILFDRNNHKSVYESGLLRAGATPVYLETSRNPLGFIGGIYDHCFEEKYIRSLLEEVDPDKANDERPFRLAVIQLGTYDGVICNARQIVDRIGHLCDYILFDSAWVGYEQFIPMMKDCSPLLLELNENDPGILVTQSVHKQQAGFSQGSYIHKKDSHIEGQKRYVDHKRFNSSYRLHASTSPFYPIFASLDVNARMQDRQAGRRMWRDCIRLGVDARKDIIKKCKMLKPFIPEMVKGKRWEEYSTEEISENKEFFIFGPEDKWHGFKGFSEGQYFVDPNKFMLSTPGIDLETGEYEDFGIPASILATYLRDNRIIPEKNDLNSILFLLTPAESFEKLDVLTSCLVRFEKLIEKDAPLYEVLPNVYDSNLDRYRGYSIRELCQEMHDFYKSMNAKDYQEKLFLKEYFPSQSLSPYDANLELIRNNAKLVPISEIEGEVALEGALPYPPGVFCVVPGEVWTETAQKYFLILEEGINRFPGFSPEIHGVYLEEYNGKKKAYGYVLEG